VKKKHFLSLVLFALVPLTTHAWWNEEWGYRKAITLDTTPAGTNIQGGVSNAPVLVRLHTGNFSYFLDVQGDGKDLRFLAGDDKTPLKHHVELFDPVNQMALVWVQAPTVPGNSNSEKLWMYYGNAQAVANGDAGGTYDVNEALVYHFNGQGAPRDQTSYGNHPAASTAEVQPASLIGAGAKFSGSGSITIPSTPSLKLTPATGWTFSTWIKIADPQADAMLMEMGDGVNTLSLAINGTAAYARLNAGGVISETPQSTNLTPGKWHHLALAAGAGKLNLYLDGAEAAAIDAIPPEMAGAVTLGATALGAQFFTGEMDEVHISNIARGPDWVRLAAQGEGMDAKLVGYGEDESADSAEDPGEASYFSVILHNVTLDGWVVIGLCAILGVVSWVVMGAKGFLLRRVRQHDQAFLAQYQKLGVEEQDRLDEEDTGGDEDLDTSPLASELFGKHDHFQGSVLYRIYHTGIREVHSRLGKAVGAQASGLEAKSLQAIRAGLDAVMVRETQKLQSQMVFLTIAISGGPFLGLLGTVVGVMITFAAIAASGDVNINAIAPGIAAALVATVAGLGVAIPALFGYNYLSSQIKEVIADMQVFTDEFIAKIGEIHGR
jgi:biopolymer transport protein ExbB